MSAELLIRLTNRQSPNPNTQVNFSLPLTAEERTRSRHRFEVEGKAVFLRLPRGTVLHDGDILTDETQTISVRITAKPEPVLTVRGKTSLDLLRGAYHLGNRHVPLEITPNYLRLSPDSVLHSMLSQLGLQITEEIVPFQPEVGAYGHHH
jgi:urease accessory protein